MSTLCPGGLRRQQGEDDGEVDAEDDCEVDGEDNCEVDGEDEDEDSVPLLRGR